MSDDKMKQILTDYGPVSVAMYASSSSFQGYTSGVYSGCPANANLKINHGALLIGYDADGNWIIKNSWGTGWGENGYATISKYYNCGITFYADYLILNDGNVEYSVDMKDSGGDGWNGYVFGVKQDGEVVSTFGEGFTSGSTSSVSDLGVGLNKTAEIFVVTAGTKST